ncbi:unnamed protein product [Phytomonas sp. Hart1]|nr:unnamed protein product [Phytomonas sp. Hart1]|eukprot:CCW67065.1 unnamed protein product [Phytomonas sp. isolate Hart1]
MRAGHRLFVEPLLGALPPPLPAPTGVLYVVDSQPHARPGLNIGAWFGCLCDAQRVTCMERWCVAAARLLWKVQLAHEAFPYAATEADKAAHIVALSSAWAEGGPGSVADSPAWLSSLPKDLLHVVSGPLSATGIAQSHAIVLHESNMGSSDLASLSRDDTKIRHASISYNGLIPRLVGDLHIIDECNRETGAGDPEEALRRNLADMYTHRATLLHTVALPSYGDEDKDSFYKLFYAKLHNNPTMSLAAALRETNLERIQRQNAPWLGIEHVLFDYGGPLESWSTAVHQSTSRQYVEYHNINSIYERMLSCLVATRPSGEAAVLDQLIHYVESSQIELEGSEKTSNSAAGPKVAVELSNPKAQIRNYPELRQVLPVEPKPSAAAVRVTKSKAYFVPEPPMRTKPKSDRRNGRRDKKK